MNKYVLNYEVKINSLTEKLLDVKLVISNAKNKIINLYKGKLKFSHFNCDLPFREDSNYYYIKSTVDILIVHYTVKINTPGKHGLYGDISNNLTVFAGEQFLLLPVEALTFSTNEDSSYIENIYIDFNFNINGFSIIPFKNNQHTNCSTLTWSNIYELLKSSYCFGNLNQYTYNKYTIYSNLSIATDTLNNIYKLLNYYEGLFKSSPKNLSIILLKASNGIDILGGCGKNIICSTFNEKKLRSWQLLSHRLFHSFMDSLLPLSDYHTPPLLWITEGLATYYENIALEALNLSKKELLNINSNREFTILFNRYLYIVLKRNPLFSFPPMEEVNIRSAAKIEFLHYTYAPLFIKLIEDTYSSRKGPNVVLMELIRLGLTYNTSLQDLFTNILDKDVNTFASKYIFSNEILPMWYLKSYLLSDTKEIIDDLNYFDYVIYTWMSLENPNYSKLPISSDILSFSIEPPKNTTSLAYVLYTYSPILYTAIIN